MFRLLQPFLVTAGHRLKINSVNLLFLTDEKFSILKYKPYPQLDRVACCYLNTKWKRIGSRLCITANQKALVCLVLLR